MKHGEKFKKERREVARFMKRLYRQGLTTTSGGNISLKVNDDIVLITPSATDKGRMKWKDVGIMNLDGKNLTPELKPSIEHEMHLSIYRKKTQIRAIVHAHPLFATAFTAIKCKIDTNLTAEARAICGEPVFVPYALMGSQKLASLAAESIEKADILLLENHGILTAGNSLLQAFDKLEVLENAARMTMIADISGKKKPLTKSQTEELDRLFRH
ncbi:MAG: class II aldolase/adducin family protein [Bacteroidales bacterium]|nr:class II aldolase/adducin family protein [Bacteroidales bacterium]